MKQTPLHFTFKNYMYTILSYFEMFGELVVQLAVGRTRHEIDRRPVRINYYVQWFYELLKVDCIHWMTRRQAEMNISEYIINM